MPDAFRRFAEIDALLARALERPESERQALLDAECGSDVELREAAMRLLAAALEEGTPVEEDSPFAHIGPRLAAIATREGKGEPSAALDAGDRFGAYVVLDSIGAGGMGEVYRARDTRLGREVALKVLPTEFSDDAGRLARLEREARLLASLDHPHINTIHELEEDAGRKAMVLELVEGPTLDEQLANGPLPPSQALRFAQQIAQALEAAHDAGVLHRDLKPTNVKIRDDGQVKVLDFGLAKSLDPRAGEEELTRPDEPIETQPGVVLGTVPYMSPEQLRGEPVDRGSDLWAFGCLLYEMLAGARAFTGNSFAATAASVLEHEPDWGALPRETPRRVEELLRRCLTKQPGRRLTDAGTARRELVETLTGGDSWVASLRSVRPGWRTAAALVAAVALALLLGYAIRQRPPAPALGAIDSIVVLPFESTSPDPEDEYLSDGMTESLINSLSRLPDLRVVPRGIAFGYKGRSADETVAAELDVRALVSGRVGERDGSLIVGVELMDAAEVAQLWGQRYTRPADDLLKVQEELARHIVDELRLELTSEQKRRALHPATENPEAYRLYLKSNYHTYRVTPEGLARGLEYAQQAVDLDPGFAPAWAALSKARMTRAFVGLEPWKEAGEKSRAATQRALELDDSLPAAHVELGFIRHHFDWDWEGAERAFARAVELEPDDADALQGHSEALLSLGRVEAALVTAQRAVAANPFTPQTHTWLAIVSHNAGRYAEALRSNQEALELEPTHVLARNRQPRLLFLNGREEEAMELLTASGKDPETSLGRASLLARAGEKEEAREILARVRSEQPDGMSWLALAETLALLGQRDSAFTILEAMLETRSRALLWINTNPTWEPLHDDPRFDDLLRRMGLPRGWSDRE